MFITSVVVMPSGVVYETIYQNVYLKYVQLITCQCNWAHAGRVGRLWLLFCVREEGHTSLRAAPDWTGSVHKPNSPLRRRTERKSVPQSIL